ncbi:gamma-glutamyltransferase [Staphylococcus nepalensis]|uniref:gamma-glutamyltransferase n=1 Tax=Staphylococcus nepalensis TaxID=214473 RepID=UPI003EE4B41F
MSIYNKKTLIIILILTIIISFLFYLITKKDNYTRDELYENKITKHNQNITNKNYGVASNNQIAVNIGEKIIEDGGNAIDASIGVSYALAITEPHSSGLGGGGAMLFYNGDKNATPQQWQYKDISSFNFKQKDKIGTPGFVRGLEDIHKDAGKMDRKKIMNYVIPLADKGFEIDAELERSLKLYGNNIDKNSPFFNKGQTKKEGDVVKQPALAKTLKGIRDNGANYFYNDIGESISKQLNNKIIEKDFKNYKSEKKEPVSTNYLNNTVYSASNPLGGTLMLQGLKIDESINTETFQNDNFNYINSILKSRDLMYANRDIVNGQNADSEEYLSQNYLINKLYEINVNSDFNTNNIDNTSTTHFVVIDKKGNLTSTTNTLASFFGSGKYIKEGFYINNSLNNFSSNPESPNYGAVHKQPRSFTAPSIVVGPDYYMGIGTPGGNKIPTLINEVLINYIKSDDTLQESIDKPRFYNDGGKIFYEKATSKEDIESFKSLGFNPVEKRDDPNYGSVQAALYNKNDKTIEIGSDVVNR